MTRFCRRTIAIPSTARSSSSQAILGGMSIVTPDAAIGRYPAPVLW